MNETDVITIDLGMYIERLLRQWRLILFATLAFTIIAALLGLSSQLSGPVYKARAMVATIKTDINVSFDSAIETLSEEDLASIRFYDPKARMQSILQLADNPDIAEQVIEEMGVRLPDELRSITSLIQATDAEVVSGSDMIAVIVTSEDPVIAAELANVWASVYIDKVNEIYSSGETQASYDTIQHQTVKAKQTYETAQSEYVSFLADARVNEYQVQVDTLTEVLGQLSASRSQVAAEIINGTLQANLIPFIQGIEAAKERLSQAYTLQRKNEHLLQDAQDMRSQVAQGGPGAVASNALALTLLKSEAYADSYLPATIQVNIDIGDMTQEEMLADLESLMATLEARQVLLDEEIAGLSAQLTAGESRTNEAGQDILSGESAQAVVQAFTELQGLRNLGELSAAGTPIENSIQELASRINEFNSSLAAEQAREQELLRARDLSWGTYETLAKKQAELGVALQTKGTEVALASPATIVSNGSTASSARNVLLAGMAGFILGVFATFAIEYWWSYKGIEPYPVTFRTLFGFQKP